MNEGDSIDENLRIKNLMNSLTKDEIDHGILQLKPLVKPRDAVLLDAMDMTKIVNEKEEKDISHLLGDLSGEEMIKLAEMPFSDLVKYMKVELKKSVVKRSLDNIEVKMSKSSTFASKLINSEKHMEKKKREAYPEPEPEPEPESGPRRKTFYGQQPSSSVSRKVSSSQPYSSYYSSLPGYRYKRSPEPEPEPEPEVPY